MLWWGWGTGESHNCADAIQLHDKTDKTGDWKLGGLGLRPAVRYSINLCAPGRVSALILSMETGNQ